MNHFTAGGSRSGRRMSLVGGGLPVLLGVGIVLIFGSGWRGGAAQGLGGNLLAGTPVSVASSSPLSLGRALTGSIGPGQTLVWNTQSPVPGAYYTVDVSLDSPSKLT